MLNAGKSYRFVLYTRMDEKRSGNFGSKISVESMRSLNSGSVSLGRPSWGQREHSLSKKASLVYVMSIESDRRSDVYDRMLEEGSYTANHVNLWNRNSSQNERDTRWNQQRMSLEEPRNIMHSCDCYAECQGQQCPCFYARSQMCIKQKCCETCIQMKNAILMADRGDFCSCKNTQCLKSYCKCFQTNGICTSLCRCEDCHNKIDSPQRAEAIEALKSAPHNEFESEGRFCTCKKTKCNKKYCSCYANGIKCNSMCQCENCNNCDRNEMAMDEESPPQFVEDEDLTDKVMPEKMSFEKIEFPHY